jgi:hypothetical protein
MNKIILTKAIRAYWEIDEDRGYYPPNLQDIYFFVRCAILNSKDVSYYFIYPYNNEFAFLRIL